MRCPVCDAELTPFARACARCGAALSDAPEAEASAGETPLRFDPSAVSLLPAGAPEPIAPRSAAAAHEGADARREIEIEYGGFWRRVAASLIDGVVFFVLVLLVGGAIGTGIGLALAGQGVDAERIAEVAGTVAQPIATIGAWLYEALFTCSSWQATPGKKLMGIFVTGLDGERIGFGRATGRYFAKTLSALTLGIGYLMVAFTERRRGLHDFLAGTLVICEVD